MMTANRFNRRRFLYHSGLGAAGIATETLLAADSKPSGKFQPHFAPTARSVIFLFMSGGPSQVDTFDPKPELARLAGQDVPESIAQYVPKIQRAGLKNLLQSPWKFGCHGESGIPVSSLLPETAKHADKLCVVRSLNHRNPVHGPGECVALTGTGAGDRPSIGAWSIYGLGSENDNLPAFLTMNLHTDGMQYPQRAGWGAAFLPSRYQGTVINPVTGIQHLQMPSKTSEQNRRRQLELMSWFDHNHLQTQGINSELDARIRSYEMAFHMQTSGPELFDLSSETGKTQTAYGIDQQETEIVGQGCLLARRMVERGVRFVQVRVGGWDAHSNLKSNHERLATRTDKPIAALLNDLQERGLLDSTLVVWGGEFGRTPTMEGRGNGRDHSPAGYTVWMSGGGAQGGKIIGETDPLGYVAIERPVTPHDFHATILHALGMDANRLTYLHHGRNEVPTVFGGAAISEVFA